MDKVEQRKWYVENISPHKCPLCGKPTITKGQYCSAECGIAATNKNNQKGGVNMKMVKLTNGSLLTEKYTTVWHEEEYTYNAPHRFQVRSEDGVLADIHFQEGPIKEKGVNGVNNEDLLNMVLCRLNGFQNSDFRCRENALAITKIEEALLWLRKRTSDREVRGVEGTHTV